MICPLSQLLGPWTSSRNSAQLDCRDTTTTICETLAQLCHSFSHSRPQFPYLFAINFPSIPFPSLLFFSHLLRAVILSASEPSRARPRQAPTLFMASLSFSLVHFISFTFSLPPRSLHHSVPVAAAAVAPQPCTMHTFSQFNGQIKHRVGVCVKLKTRSAQCVNVERSMKMSGPRQLPPLLLLLH